MNRDDLRIEVDGDRVTILIREKFFWFIDIWSELTIADTEYGDESVLLFKDVNEATNFIEMVCISDK
jgi:hypothetical protein